MPKAQPQESELFAVMEADMMEAHLGVITCDKCGEPMKEGQPVLVIAEGSVTESGDELDFHGSCVQYACHLDCWDGGDETSIISKLEEI